jgi:transglycosylase-like protein with SLT domain
MTTTITFSDVKYVSNNSIKLFQQALTSHGHPISTGVTGVYDNPTRVACADFQIAQGWSGSGADGLPGPLTFARLGLVDGGTTPPPPSGTVTPVIAPDGPGTPSGYKAHPVSFWAPLIGQAMTLVGGGVQAHRDTAGVERLMLSESSGNPNAINNYDINAQNGDPSRGLMQTIGTTFNAYHIAGTSTNIYDPLANICSALNYINHRYGGIIPNSPY